MSLLEAYKATLERMYKNIKVVIHDGRRLHVVLGDTTVDPPIAVTSIWHEAELAGRDLEATAREDIKNLCRDLADHREDQLCRSETSIPSTSTP